MAKAGHNRLGELKATIETHDNAVRRAAVEGVKAAMDAGDALIEARGILGHGKFMPWLAANVSVAGRTARLYMTLAKKRAKIEAKMATVANLTIRQAAAVVTGEVAHERFKRQWMKLWSDAPAGARSDFIKGTVLPEMAADAARWGLGADVVKAFRDGAASDKPGGCLSDFVPQWALQRFRAYTTENPGGHLQ